MARKNYENLQLGSQRPSQGLKWAPLTYKSNALPLEPSPAVNEIITKEL